MLSCKKDERVDTVANVEPWQEFRDESASSGELELWLRRPRRAWPQEKAM